MLFAACPIGEVLQGWLSNRTRLIFETPDRIPLTFIGVVPYYVDLAVK